MRSVLIAALPELLGEQAPGAAVARREVEAPLADEAELRPMLTRLADEHPHVWATTRPVASGGKAPRVLVVLETVAATPAEAESNIDPAVRFLLSLAAGTK
jgi:hypothetical protein